MDNETRPLSRLLMGLVVISIALIVSGTNACRENYNFASQTTLAPTSSETPSETVTTTATTTPSGTATEPPEPDDEPTETPTSSPTPTATPKKGKAMVGAGLLQSLQSLSEMQTDSAPAAANPGSNWLGHIYDKQELSGVSADSDGDGFTDELEGDSGSDPSDMQSVPAQPPATRLAARLLGSDDDADGVLNEEEAKAGTSPNNPDSDGDGSNDGAEILSETDPSSRASRALDSDGDGLSNDFESEQDLNWQNPDTDGDRLRDDIELAIGCDPRDNDSDRDGILDGKEVELGSDPLIAEPAAAKKSWLVREQ